MMNGCICCTVRQDLVEVLKKLAARIQAGTLKLDGIIIETTGMADPAPVAQTFFVDDDVKAFARLDGIVTLIDAKHIEQHLDEVKAEGAENEAVEQVAFADRMLLNKTDLVTEEDLTRIEARLKSMNGSAPIIRCQQSSVSVENVLNIGAFDLKSTLEMDPKFLDTDSEHVHDTSVTSLCIIQPGNVDMKAIEDWMSKTLREKAVDIYRMKGILSVEYAEQKFVYQGVHMISNGNFEGSWSEGEKRESKLVFIGKNLDHEGLKKGFEACLNTPELLKKQEQSLRFGIGDQVECKTGTVLRGKNKGDDKWETGQVVSLMDRKEYMRPGRVAPYTVKLDGQDGDLIYALQTMTRSSAKHQ
jgi:G3E family GTPase